VAPPEGPRRLVLAGALLVAGNLALAAGPARAAERRHVDGRTGLLEIPVDELVLAVRRKDRAEIGRVAERLGPARLADALHRPDAATVNAALAGILVLPGRERLLGPVTELVSGSDAASALAGLRALGEILSPLTPADLDDWEVPADVVKSACAAMRVTALVAASPTANRLAALDALADAAVPCAAATADLVALLRDPTPSIRRAAALVLRPPQRLATGGFASGIRDIDRSVATASAAALCEALAMPGGAGAGSGSGSREPIWEQTREAARRLVVANDTPAEDAVEMLDCLDPSLATDRQMLERFRGRRRTPLGDRAAEILVAFGNRTGP
jgi:hypothetical protein